MPIALDPWLLVDHLAEFGADDALALDPARQDAYLSGLAAAYSGSAAAWLRCKKYRKQARGQPVGRRSGTDLPVALSGAARAGLYFIADQSVAETRPGAYILADSGAVLLMGNARCCSRKKEVDL